MKSTIHINGNLNGLQDLQPATGNVYVIIDKNLQHLAVHFKQFPIIIFEGGENNKLLENVSSLASSLLEAGADRDALIIGVGGGITTDITGFTASIYKRGVKFAFVPTTLLAQVDASIGGKNGVNLHSYKNILGTINQPEWVFICPELLRTLPEDEFKAGIAEVLKTFILLLSPFAPHICEEMWENLGQSGFCSTAAWPEYDEALTIDDEIEIAVQVCGKLKGTIVIPKGAEEDAVWDIITANAGIMASLEGKQIIKKIYIKDKIFNIVAK